MGEYLREMDKNKGRAGMGRPKLGGISEEPPKDSAPTYEEIGISNKEGSEAQTLAGIPDEDKEKSR